MEENILINNGIRLLVQKNVQTKIKKNYYVIVKHIQKNHLYGIKNIGKEDFIMKLIEEWLEKCTIENLSPITHNYYTGFSHHTAEQSVFNMIYYNKIKNKIIKPINILYSTDHDLNVIYNITLKMLLLM